MLGDGVKAEAMTSPRRDLEAAEPGNTALMCSYTRTVLRVYGRLEVPIPTRNAPNGLANWG